MSYSSLLAAKTLIGTLIVCLAAGNSLACSRFSSPGKQSHDQGDPESVSCNADELADCVKVIVTCTDAKPWFRLARAVLRDREICALFDGPLRTKASESVELLTAKARVAFACGASTSVNSVTEIVARKLSNSMTVDNRALLELYASDLFLADLADWSGDFISAEFYAIRALNQFCDSNELQRSFLEELSVSKLEANEIMPGVGAVGAIAIFSTIEFETSDDELRQCGRDYAVVVRSRVESMTGPDRDLIIASIDDFIQSTRK